MDYQRLPLLSGWHIKHPTKPIDLTVSMPTTVFEALLDAQLIPDRFMGGMNMTWHGFMSPIGCMNVKFT